MNWYKQARQQYLWDNDPDLDYANMEFKKEIWNAKFPKAGNIVSGLGVGDSIDNTDSISASMDEYYILEGIRECPMSYFGTEGYANVNENKRSEELAKEIKISGEINPLIVGIDEEGPYILEGGHRFQALQILGVQSFPALVVLESNELV